jgi:hypothetical protein
MHPYISILVMTKGLIQGCIVSTGRGILAQAVRMVSIERKIKPRLITVSLITYHGGAPKVIAGLTKPGPLPPFISRKKSSTCNIYI